MRRRTFLSSSAAAGLVLPAHAAPNKLPAGDIPRRVFGKTGERLTIIGQAGGRFPLCGVEEAKAITLRAYELGAMCYVVKPARFEEACEFMSLLERLCTAYVALPRPN